MSQTQLKIAQAQIQYARNYTLSLLEDIDDSDWFRPPAGGATHVAWQVGHLAMAQYALALMRIRGKEPEDQEFISNDFFRQFAKGSTPQADPADNPSPEQIRTVLHQVHQRVLQELPRYTDQELNVPLPEPHAVFDTKMGSLFFCAAHELIHAGQIGLIRRLLGKAPLR